MIWNQVQIRENSQIGDYAIIGKNCYIDINAKIGNRVKIQNNVSVYNGVVIDDDVFIGPSVTFSNDLYPRATNADWKVLPTLVKKGASIGANATIVCGNTIGEYSMVGSGSVVTHDVLPHALVVGNPAKQIGWVCDCGRKLNDELRCDYCKKIYSGLQ